MQLSDVLIHINEIPNEFEQDRLVNQFRNLDGVITPRFNTEKENVFKAQVVGK